jgi:hypothetical protein
MFKQAYCRGTQLALIQSGHVAYSDGSDAIKVADFIAERIDFDPANVSPEITKKIAGHLIDASKEVQKSQPNFKAASFGKIESWDAVHKIASDNAVDLMAKAEKVAEGSTIEGGDKGNPQSDSPQGETKMDAADRPPGYATNSLGHTEVDTKPGAVGSEKDQPNKPTESPSGSNSVTEQRTASLADIMRKVAEGSTILGGDKGNQEPTTGEGKMDLAMRPAGYALLPSQGALGELMNQVKGTAVVGRETAHPNAPAQGVSGTNSLTEHSAKAAAEDPFLTLFKKTASEVVPYMPMSISDDAKVAHVRACMGMQLEEKAAYLKGLQAQERTAGAPPEVPPGARGDKYQQHSPEATHSRPGAYDGRTGNQGTKAAELPDFLRDKMEGKKDDGEKKDDDKKSDNPFAKKDDDDKKSDNPFAKKDDDKEKEAAMRAHLGRIHDAMRAG